MRVRSLGWADLLDEGTESTSVFLPGESLGWRSLVGYSPQGRVESDTTRAHAEPVSCACVSLPLMVLHVL